MAKRTAVYRLFDAEDALLYVGISSQPKERWNQHANEKRWWPDVARKAVTWYERREEAIAREADAIDTELPRYNAVRPPQDVQPMTVRLPKPMREHLRRLAFETRQSMNDIAVTAIDNALKENRNAHASDR